MKNGVKPNAITEEPGGLPGIYKFAEFLDLLADRAEASGALDDFKLATANIHRLFSTISRERAADIQKAQDDPEQDNTEPERPEFHSLVRAFIEDVKGWREGKYGKGQEKIKTIILLVNPNRRLEWQLRCNDIVHAPDESPCPECERRAEGIHALVQEASRLAILKRRGSYAYFGEMNIGPSDLKCSSAKYSRTTKRVAGDSGLEFELRAAVTKAKKVTQLDER